MTCGAVNALATIAAAVCLRTPLIGIRCSPPTRAGRSGPGTVAGGTVGRGAGGGGVDVGAGDDAAGAGAADGGEVDAEVLGVLAHRRLGQRPQRTAAPGSTAARAPASAGGGVRLGRPADLQAAVPDRLDVGVGRGGQQRRAVGARAVVGLGQDDLRRRWPARGRRPRRSRRGRRRASVLRGP